MSPDLELSPHAVLTVNGRTANLQPYTLVITDAWCAIAWAQLLARDYFKRPCQLTRGYDTRYGKPP